MFLGLCPRLWMFGAVGPAEGKVQSPTVESKVESRKSKVWEYGIRCGLVPSLFYLLLSWVPNLIRVAGGGGAHLQRLRRYRGMFLGLCPRLWMFGAVGPAEGKVQSPTVESKVEGRRSGNTGFDAAWCLRCFTFHFPGFQI